MGGDGHGGFSSKSGGTHGIQGMQAMKFFSHQPG
jgi:hypothetical protein